MQKILYRGIEIFKVLPLDNQCLNQAVTGTFQHSINDDTILNQMIDTLRYQKQVLGTNSVALSANQIGWDVRLFLMVDLQAARKNNLYRKIDAIINPRIVEKSDEIGLSEEICLSLNDVSFVPRSNKIKVVYQNLMNQEIVAELKMLSAYIFQHEFDHLEGISVLQKAQKFEIIQKQK
ncbi:hypothetical protein pb186bvf_004671 [Paramecium bursaria]